MKKLCMILLAGCALTGCSQLNNPIPETQLETEAQPETKKAANIRYKKTKEPVAIKPMDAFIYKQGEDALLMSDGKWFGNVGVNQVQKVGISDWYNTKATSLGIDYSYSINLHVDAAKFVEAKRNILLTAEISLVDMSDRQLSEYCSIGWTGFPEVAELYESTTAANIEIGLQPISLNLPSDTRLKIVLTDTVSETVFDSIYYNFSVLENAVSSGTLYREGDEIIIKSINGAKYSLEFARAEMNDRKTSNGNAVSVYDLKYLFRYKRKPKNERIVSIFDAFDKNKISPNIAFSVQSDNDATKLYTVISTALEYTDKNKPYNYITNPKTFKAGEGYIYLTNRKIEENVQKATDYVRVLVEFPEERAARTDQEMLKFNGRFLVIQLKLKEHVVPKNEDIFGSR